MKDPQTILEHLFQNPSRFYEYRCLNRLKELLPLQLRHMIHYLYRRDSILYIVLKHPGFVMEINYNTNLIKELLTLLQTKEPLCKGIHIEQIKAYAKYLPSKVTPPPAIQSYKERATGNFTSSQTFAPIFEKIKEAIKSNGKTTR